MQHSLLVLIAEVQRLKKIAQNEVMCQALVGSLEIIPSSKEIKFKCFRLLESKLEEKKGLKDEKDIIIMEYLVNISKRRSFWSLNDDILKITILTTNTLYPSRKIRRIRACTHQKTTNETSSIRRIQRNSIRRIQDIHSPTQLASRSSDHGNQGAPMRIGNSNRVDVETNKTIWGIIHSLVAFRKHDMILGRNIIINKKFSEFSFGKWDAEKNKALMEVEKEVNENKVYNA
ncbi:hypothetical protein Tco_0730886 [Tanacetum coccineum]